MRIKYFIKKKPIPNPLFFLLVISSPSKQTINIAKMLPPSSPNSNHLTQSNIIPQTTKQTEHLEQKRYQSRSLEEIHNEMDKRVPYRIG